jgi:hypothetical protein
MKTKQQLLFESFVSTDDLRLNINNPFEFKDKVYATDGHKLIRCDKNLIDFNWSNSFTSQNAETLFENIQHNRVVKQSIKSFNKLKTEDEFKKNGEDIECSECKGHGVVEWSYKGYNEDFDCPACGGSCYSFEGKNIKTGKKTFPKYECYAQIDRAFFDINVLYSIYEAQKVIGEEIIMINVCEETRTPAIFKIGVYELLIMPVINREIEPKIIISFK